MHITNKCINCYSNIIFDSIFIFFTYKYTTILLPCTDFNSFKINDKDSNDLSPSNNSFNFK